MLRENIHFRFGGPITKNVKNLMIINAAIFLLQQFADIFMPGEIEHVFGLHHIGLFYEFKIWQPFTYMFLHGNWLHIFFNLIALWMFAGDLEERWGKKMFLQFYIFTGVGAGISISIMNFIIYYNYGQTPITIGASGAIYGILLAYGLTWPNREVLIYFLLPVKIKYLVLAFGIMEFFGTLSSAIGSGGNISHIGHLGGFISGFIYIIYKGKGRRTVYNSASDKSNGYIRQFIREQKLKRKQKEIDKRIDAKGTIDALLEKIARKGMSSLSPKEKRLLEWARKHYYPDDSDIVH